jgi:hypothetical protein
VDFTYQVGLVKIAVVSVFVNGDIQVKNVSVFEGASVRDAVANNLIYTGAATARESVVVKGTRIGVLMKLWTASSISSVVTPTFTIAWPTSKAYLPSRHAFLIPSIYSLSLTGIALSANY